MLRYRLQRYWYLKGCWVRQVCSPVVSIQKNPNRKLRRTIPHISFTVIHNIRKNCWNRQQIRTIINLRQPQMMGSRRKRMPCRSRNAAMYFALLRPPGFNFQCRERVHVTILCKIANRKIRRKPSILWRCWSIRVIRDSNSNGLLCCVHWFFFQFVI